ncbi:MAG: hypothetical protein MK085_06645 [Phycisphaerales bacterium]|nr:hypothetical protein [Phycisphaerales bacterium]
MIHRRAILTALLGVVLTSPWARGEDHVVETRAPWPTPAQVKPGDRILLAPGLHPAQVLRRYKGTQELPIRIDSIDQSAPAIVGGGTWPLDLVECDHLLVGTIMVTSGLEGGIRIQGTPEAPSTNVRLIGTYLAQPGRKPGVSNAIQASFVDSLVLESVQIDAWKRAAIRLDDAQRVFMQNVIMGAKMDSQIGVDIGRNVKDVNIRHLFVEHLRGAGVQVSTDNAPSVVQGEAANQEDVRWQSERIYLDRCSFIKTRHPIVIGNARSVNITRNLFLDPTSCVMALRKLPEPFGPPTDIRFDKNLIQWEVGELGAFLCSAEDAGNLAIGENLWWSQEMPDAVEYLGPLPGDADSRQIYHLDPKLTPRGLAPRAPLARQFGPYAGIEGTTGTKSPGDNP